MKIQVEENTMLNSPYISPDSVIGVPHRASIVPESRPTRKIPTLFYQRLLRFAEYSADQTAFNDY